MTAPETQLTPLTPLAPAADTLTANRPASLWRDTLGSVLRQRSAVFGLVDPDVPRLHRGLRAGPRDARPQPEPPRQGAGCREARPAPCIHALGCPADEPQHFFGTDGNFRDVYSRVRLRNADVADHRVRGHRLRDHRGDDHRRVRGLCQRVDGQRPDALHGRHPGVPVTPARDRDRHRRGPKPRECPGRHRHRVDPDLRARRASAVLSTRESDFVTASRALGESSLGILGRRILPNSITPLIVQGTLGIGAAVLEIAALAFVGVTGDSEQPRMGLDDRPRAQPAVHARRTSSWRRAWPSR